MAVMVTTILNVVHPSGVVLLQGILIFESGVRRMLPDG